MGMRITNSIMNNNTKKNINSNKLNEDKINTKIASGQKITRPSDDPVIAIRALRLNSNIAQSNQFYDKNIPDAEAWMKITETALSQTDSVLTKIHESLTTGASDDNTAEDRRNILADLQSMRDQIYSSGNADYADRTVFTGYRTGEALTFREAETNDYRIREEWTADDISKITHIFGDFAVDETGSDLTTNHPEQSIEDRSIYRVRLAYDHVKYPQTVSLQYSTDGGATMTAVTVVYSEKADDAAYDTSTLGANEARLIAETGELILSNDLRDTLQHPGTSDISIEYNKESWKKNDLRPEHFFQCTDGVGIDYNKFDAQGNPMPHFENQSISYEISFGQSIIINTNANQVFTHDICRDVDELMAATQAVIDAEDKLEKLQKMAAQTERYSAAQLEEINARIASMRKEKDLLADKMQKMFSQGLTRFTEYSDRTNLAITEVGAARKRLELTKERVNDQKNTFKELADANININLSDTAIELTNAELSLEAARLAAGKIAKQTLLNYL